MVFWKFTALFDHRHRFFLCRENHYGSSMIQCINQLSTQSFGTDLIVVIVRLRSAEAILKRVKSVNHCCKERISMHCYSDPHFSTDPANEYLITKIQSVWPCICINLLVRKVSIYSVNTLPHPLGISFNFRKIFWMFVS